MMCSRRPAADLTSVQKYFVRTRCSGPNPSVFRASMCHRHCTNVKCVSRRARHIYVSLSTRSDGGELVCDVFTSPSHRFDVSTKAPREVATGCDAQLSWWPGASADLDARCMSGPCEVLHRISSHHTRCHLCLPPQLGLSLR